MKDNDNVYFRARKEAAINNERLYSREGAAELLGISVSTLADYELGNTKVVPVDKVNLMADLYGCPELKTLYCKQECPIGRKMPLATQAGSIEGATIRFLKEFDSVRLEDMRSSLIEIASDGRVDENEKTELQVILKMVDDLALVLSEMKLIGEKAMKG